MRLLAHISIVLLMVVWASDVECVVVKKDLRSSPSPGEQFLLFCATGPDSAGSVGFVSGDVDGGLQFDDWFVGGPQQSPSDRQRAAQRARVEACERAAFTDISILFVVQIDPKAYADALRALAAFRRSGRRNTTELAISLGQVVAIRLPTTLSLPFDYFRYMGQLNSGARVNGGQWLWVPPTIAMNPANAPAKEQVPATDSLPRSRGVSNSRAGLIPTGLATVASVDRSALEHLYQALGDAEDHSNISYAIELEITGAVIANIFVHPVEMKRDAPLERGDSACVFATGETQGINFVELLDALLLLPRTNPAAISHAWGFTPSHPLLGSPAIGKLR